MAKADVMAGRAFVSLYMKQDAFVKGLRAAQQKMQKFGAEMTAMGRQLVAMSAAGVVPMAMATKRFADFDDAMRMVKAVSRSTEQQFQTLTDTAKMLGATTSYTAVEVASLMTELGRAGFTADEINVMTASVMNLARATGTDATLASGIMAASLRQFGLQATDAARVSDVLTLAANSTFNTVEGLGESLKYAGPIAKELGMSFEDTAAILGTLGNVGIQGSEAGTALRRLSVISAATGKDLKEIFGISNVDASGNLKPLVQIMGEIGQAVEKMPVAERVTKMNEAFGLLGITSASVLSGAAMDTEKLAEELKNAGGTAANAAKEMDAGLGGAFRIIMSAVEGVAIELGNAISEPLQKAVKFGSDFLTIVVQIIKRNKDTVVWFSKLALVVGGLGVGIVAIGLTFTALSVAVGGFAAAISFAATVMGAIGTAIAAILSPVGILVGGLIAGATAWARFTASGQAAVTGLGGFISSTFGGIWQTVTDTFGVIADAIGGGDVELAGQIAMLGLRLVFAQGLEQIHALFGETLGAMAGQLLSGDFSGAFATLGSVLLDSWAKITGGLVSLFTGAADAVMNKWQQTVNAISDYILEQASQGGVMGWGLEQISGVNMPEEVARGKRIEAERRARGMTPDNGSGMTKSDEYQHPGLAAMKESVKAAGQAANAAMADVTDATGQAVADKTAGTSAKASAEVARLQAELDSLRKNTTQKVDALSGGGGAGAQSPDYSKGGMFGESSTGKASAASFNLMSLNTTAAQNQLRATVDTKKAIERQTKRQEELFTAQIEATKNGGLYHA